MLRKTMLAVIAVAAIGLGTTADVSARGGGGGGGHGGGHGGGFGGGGFRGGGFRGGGIGYGGYYGYGYPFAYGGYYDDDEGGCYLVRQRVRTRHGYRIRRVEVCS
jgi:hypothetical protein